MKIYFKGIIKNLLTALYKIPECGCGGIAHIITDDLNTSDEDLAFVLTECEKEQWRMEVPLVKCLIEYLRRLNQDERYDIIQEYWSDQFKF